MGLTPEQLKYIPDTMVSIFEELEEFIIRDFIRRLEKAGEITDSAQWIAIRAKEIGLSTESIKKEVERITKLSEEEVRYIFKQSALESIDSDNRIFEAGGLDTIKISEHAYLKTLLDAAIRQSDEELRNLTGSLGFAEVIDGKVVYSSIGRFYQKHLDLAHMKVATGVADYNTAVKHAVRALTKSGVRYVDYMSGWSNRIDVAARRAVMTGTNQMAAKMVDYNCEVLGVELVEVSAHSGARPDHQSWHGQIYTKGIATDKYDNFEEATSYGEGHGLCGWNCRHTYSPYLEGTARTYTKEQLDEMKYSTVNYEGRVLSEYQASQYQRRLETKMRQCKRELIAYDAAGLKKDFDYISIRLQGLRKEYNKFARETGLSKQDARHQLEGFGRSIAQRSSRVK
ncbi:MAG: phage minor capsid protein [Paraclostridium sp.]